MNTRYSFVNRRTGDIYIVHAKGIRQAIEKIDGDLINGFQFELSSIGCCDDGTTPICQE